jgi:hypothetical protein
MEENNSKREQARGPFLDEQVIAKITDGLRRLYEIELKAGAEDWGTLEQALRRYQDVADCWAGFLNKGKTSDLESIGKKAGKLAKALELSIDGGLGLIIQLQLGDHDLGTLMSALQQLSELEPTSPKTEPQEKESWERLMFFAEADLQTELDRWWKHATRKEPGFIEGKATPYTYFLTQAFSALPGANLGCSRTTVEARRRVREKRDAQYKLVARKLKTLAKAHF